MPELLVTPSTKPSSATATNGPYGGTGSDDAGSGLPFAALLQERLAPSTQHSQQTLKTLLTGEAASDINAQLLQANSPYEGTDNEGSTLGLLSLALMRQEGLPLSTQHSQQTLKTLLTGEAASDIGAQMLQADPLDPGAILASLFPEWAGAAKTDAVTRDEAESPVTMVAGDSAQVLITAPVQIPIQPSVVPQNMALSQGHGNASLLSQQSNELSGLLQQTPATPTVLPTQAGEPPGAATAATAATAIVADIKANTGETGEASGKIDSVGAGPADQFHELLTAAQNNQGMTKGVGTATPSATPARIDSPVGTMGWNNELGDKLVWMSNRTESRAELVLNPPHMGRIEVSITVNGDQANAIFVSANQSVRDALEGALPRLREILADAGVRLDQAHVGTESPGGQANPGESGDNPRRQHSRREPEFVPGLLPIAASATNWQAGGNGLVDTFA